MSVKLGMTYQIKVNDVETPLLLNALVYGSETYIRNGFLTEPKPSIGKSAAEIGLTDGGVLLPVDFLSVVKIGNTVLSKSVQGKQHIAKWSSVFEYRYAGALVKISEIGIDGFSRALITDVHGKIFPITVKNGDYLRVEVAFTLTVTDNSLITNLNGVPLGYSLTYSFNQLTDTAWWSLLNGLSGYVGVIDSDGQKVNVLPYSITSTLLPNRLTDAMKFTLPNGSFDKLTLSSELLGEFSVLKFDVPQVSKTNSRLNFPLNITW